MTRRRRSDCGCRLLEAERPSGLCRRCADLAKLHVQLARRNTRATVALMQEAQDERRRHYHWRAKAR